MTVQRPDAADAGAQEMALLNPKNDVKMILDGVPANEVRPTLRELFTEYVAAGIDHAGWLLATSDWPSLYFRSRQLDDVAAMWRANDVPELIAPSRLTVGIDVDEAKLAQSIKLNIEGPYGLSGLLLMMNHLVSAALDELQPQMARPGDRYTIGFAR